jgi:hypothetical protein
LKSAVICEITMAKKISTSFGASNGPKPITLGLDRKCMQHFQALSNNLKAILFIVMAGLVPAIHVFLVQVQQGRGCPAQGRA